MSRFVHDDPGMVLVARNDYESVRDEVIDCALDMVRLAPVHGMSDAEVYDFCVTGVVEGCEFGSRKDWSSWAQETAVAIAQRTARESLDLTY